MLRPVPLITPLIIGAATTAISTISTLLPLIVAATTTAILTPPLIVTATPTISTPPPLIVAATPTVITIVISALTASLIQLITAAVITSLR